MVAKRTEEDLLDWLGTEVGFLTGLGHYNEEPLVLEPFQIAFLESKSRYRWVEKARQVGFSFCSQPRLWRAVICAMPTPQ